jgi:hypothetical protein
VTWLEKGSSAVTPDDVPVTVEEVRVRVLLEAQLLFETEMDASRSPARLSRLRRSCAASRSLSTASGAGERYGHAGTRARSEVSA